MFWLIILVGVLICQIVGFLVAKLCKEKVEEVPPHYLAGGIRRRDFYRKTWPRARRMAKWLTLALSEYLLSHWDYLGCEYDDGGQTKVFLGYTLQEAIDRLLQLGTAHFDDEIFSQATAYFNSGYELCMSEAEKGATEEEMKDWEERAEGFRRMRDNAQAEIHYLNGSVHFRNRNFVAAEECLRAAFELCWADDRKEVFRQKRGDADAEIQNQQGVRNHQDGNFEAAKHSFENAILLCTDAKRKRTFEANLKNAEAELHHQLGERALEGAGHDRQRCETAVQNFDLAVEECMDNYVRREIFQDSLRQATVILQNLTNSANCFQLGMDAWNAACDHETQRRANDAENQYDEAFRRFNDAHELVNDNTDYQEWAILCGRKIRGNELFNDSVLRMNEGNVAFRASQYRTARQRYVESQQIAADALNVYREGALMGIENERFDTYAANVERLNTILRTTINATNLRIPMEQFQENERINELFQQRQNNDHAIIHHAQI